MKTLKEKIRDSEIDGRIRKRSRERKCLSMLLQQYFILWKVREPLKMWARVRLKFLIIFFLDCGKRSCLNLLLPSSAKHNV